MIMKKLLLILCLSVGAIVRIRSAGCIPPPSGLVAWWPGEGNAKDIVSTNDGTLVASASFGQGMVRSAFMLDGASAIDLGNPAVLQLQDFTIEMWLKRSSLGPPEAELLCYGQGGYGFGMSADGTLYITAVGLSGVFASVKVVDMNWHHVALTKSGSIVVFYVDGVAYPAPSYGPAFAFSTPIAIGARGDNHSSGFNGLLDEVSI
jgi:hypothetical protein